MAKYLLISLSNAVEGKEDEFNDWYTNRHMLDLLAVDGFVAAQRFRRANVEPPAGSDTVPPATGVGEAKSPSETAGRVSDGEPRARSISGQFELPLPYDYLTVYEVETDDLARTAQVLRDTRPGRRITSAIKTDGVGPYFSPITRVVTSKTSAARGSGAPA